MNDVFNLSFFKSKLLVVIKKSLLVGIINIKHLNGGIASLLLLKFLDLVFSYFLVFFYLSEILIFMLNLSSHAYIRKSIDIALTIKLLINTTLVLGYS